MISLRPATTIFGLIGRRMTQAFRRTIRGRPRLIKQAVVSGVCEVPWTIDDLIAEGDRVVYRWTAQGVHQSA